MYKLTKASIFKTSKHFESVTTITVSFKLEYEIICSTTTNFKLMHVFSQIVSLMVCKIRKILHLPCNHKHLTTYVVPKALVHRDSSGTHLTKIVIN